VIVMKDAKSNAQAFGKSINGNICESLMKCFLYTGNLFSAFAAKSRCCVKSSTGICSKLF